jgi:hypothetical protein
MRYAAGRRRNGAADELRELALLEEFNCSDSVAALAGAISARLGRKARSKDLIAEALGARAYNPASALVATRSSDTTLFE